VFELFMAVRYLRRHKVIYFSIAGVTLGIIAMVIVTSVMGGFSRDIRARIRGMQSHLMLSRVYTPPYLMDSASLVRDIRALPHVASAAPRIEQPAWLESRGRSDVVYVVGIDPAEEGPRSGLVPFFAKGDKDFTLGYDDGKPLHWAKAGAVVGKEMHDKRGAWKGTKIGVPTSAISKWSGRSRRGCSNTTRSSCSCRSPRRRNGWASRRGR
jgi:lipoprotein-releasing system permease protein